MTITRSKIANPSINLDEVLRLPLDIVLEEGDRLARECFGNTVELCGIISIRGGNCEMNCKFCAQSRFNSTGAAIYKLLDKEELKNRIHALSHLPLKHIGLVASGGALSDEELESVCDVIADLPAEIRKKICASLGRLSREKLQILKSAGCGHYHHNLETSRDFYPSICSTQKWEDRLATVETALDIGMEVCSGFLFGLGENWQDRESLALALRKIGVKNIPMNFLDPVPGTSFASSQPLHYTEALRIIHLFRAILPDATLRVCGGRLKCLGRNQHLAMKAGANALMTGDFLTTRGNALNNDLAMLESLNLRVVQ